ncbi:glycerate dehydrogenase [Lasiosphaeria ovina]|uniref:Glycerate dehydrogenase n=1 Tax=Lasiosphaeria ovina TaxID=92902 RepID=A0AAE0KIX0_9PEZI|nr:glycerate dehydrogenase [Lasiosphaeria ovina]
MARETIAPARRHHKIVALEGGITPIPDLTPAMPEGHTYELALHERTPHADAALIASRVSDADVVITTVCPLSGATLSPVSTPHLRFVAVMASGHDVVDLAACRGRGVVVSNSPGSNVDAVAEHSIGLYFSVRRSIVHTHALTRAGQWPRRGGILASAMYSPGGRLPLPMRDEVVGILGYGFVGKRIAELCRALGMKRVLVAGRKGGAAVGSPPRVDNGVCRASFGDVVRTATVLFLCLPRVPETMGLIAEAELSAMRPQAVIVNVSRGGIVDEHALVAALKMGKIAGAATDVFLAEPAGPENSVLLAEDTAGLNLVVTPHVAWVSQATTQNYQDTLVGNLKAFLNGQPQNVVS